MELGELPPGERDEGRYAAICKPVYGDGGSLDGIRFSGKRGVDSLDEMQATDDGCGRRNSTWVCQSELGWASECLRQWRVGFWCLCWSW